MRFLLIFSTLFGFWFLLSGETNLILIFFGLVSSLLVTYLTGDFILSGNSNLKTGFFMLIKFIKYLRYLLYQIIIANIDVMYRVLHPKMPIDPVVIKFKTNIKKDFCLVVYGNSITLTPGTVTIDITREREYIVHSLSKKYADALLSREMENKIKEIEDV